MSRREKLIARLKHKPKDLTWYELIALLKALGYNPSKTGKTGGSRRRFIHPTAPPISLHKPHPDNVIKRYIIDDILETLKHGGLI